jgi:hypothetical protein
VPRARARAASSATPPTHHPPPTTHHPPPATTPHRVSKRTAVATHRDQNHSAVEVKNRRSPSCNRKTCGDRGDPCAHETERWETAAVSRVHVCLSRSTPACVACSHHHTLGIRMDMSRAFLTLVTHAAMSVPDVKGMHFMVSQGGDTTPACPSAHGTRGDDVSKTVSKLTQKSNRGIDLTHHP